MKEAENQDLGGPDFDFFTPTLGKQSLHFSNPHFLICKRGTIIPICKVETVIPTWPLSQGFMRVKEAREMDGHA